MGEAAQTLDAFDRLEGTWQLRRRIVQWRGRSADTSHTVAVGGANDRADAATSIAGASMRPDAMVAGRLIGSARFTRIDPDTLHYQEQGTLTLQQPGRHAAATTTTVHAVRAYRYRRDKGAWTIDFADGPNMGSPYLRLAPIDIDAERLATRQRDAESRRHGHGDALAMRDSRDSVLAGSADGHRRGELSDVGRAASDSDWIAVDHHLCGRDLYQAAFRLHGFAQADPIRHRIVQRTTVTGPRKDYAIVSVLRRIPDGVS